MVYKLHHDLTVGVMIRPNTWGNSAYLQDHDGEVTMESQRALRPSNHTQVEDQLEDTPGLPSPYTGSPGELLKIDLDTLCMAESYREDQQHLLHSHGPMHLRLVDLSVVCFILFADSLIGSLIVQYTKLAYKHCTDI